MAVNPIGCKLRYKGQALSIPKERTQNEGCFVSSTVSPDVSGSFSSISKDTSRRSHVLHTTSDSLVKVNIERKIEVSRGFIRSRGSMSFHILGEASFLSGIYKPMSHVKSSSNNSSEREKVCTVWNALESSSGQKQLRSLDSYFQKLQNTTNRATKPSNDSVLLLDISCQSNAKNGLASLEEYLGKVNEDAKSMDYVPSASDDVITKAARYPVMKGSQSEVKKRKKYVDLESRDGGAQTSSYDETSSLYAISILASINIAVFLFEIASPIRNTDLELFSLPLLYGAKINHMILLGEWWRLLTPMFLHSGIFHVALGCWGLLTFGPQVCRAYGSLTFFLIYILGGLSGNMTSFLHTPEPTVGGTGPVFALIGAWLIYHTQNRDASGKEASQSMFEKAILFTALSCTLSNFGPVDDWTHLGAAFAGMVYGFFTCPTLQMDDASTKAGQEEGITLVRQYADPCKSLAFFFLLVLVLSSLLFIVEPPLNSIASDLPV